MQQLIISLLSSKMYNYQTFLREKQILHKCEQINREHDEVIASRQKKNPFLVHLHKKRIEGFILSLIEKPTQVSVYKIPKREARTFDKSKNLAGNSFIMNHHKQSARISQSQQKNKILDQVPFHNTADHIFRDLGSTGMHFKPRNNSLRVKQYLDKQSLNYLPNSINSKIEQTIRKFDKENTCLDESVLNASKLKRETLKKAVIKSLLPLLHQKTYFHSVNTIFCESPNCFQKDKKKETSSQEESYEEEGESEFRKQNMKGNERFNRKENSREALIKCGLLPRKSACLSNEK